MFMRIIRQRREPIADESRSRRRRPLRVALALRRLVKIRCASQGVEAPGPQGARRANIGGYLTDERRRGQGWIGVPTAQIILTSLLTAALALGGLASCDKGGDKSKKGEEDEKAAKAWMTAELSTRQDQVGDVKYSIDLPPGVKTKSTANKLMSYWMAKGRWAGVTGPTFRVVKEGRLPASADELAEQIQVSPNVKAIKKQKMKNGYMVVYRSRSGGSVRVVLVKGQGDKVLRCNALYVQTTKPRAMKSAQAQLINVCNSLKIL